jgi:hypothetical protein
VTLDPTKTADDATLIQALTPLLQDKIWYQWDRRRWYVNQNGTWQHVPLARIQAILAKLAEQLPDDPYWKRSRHRLTWFSSQQQILTQIRQLYAFGDLTPPALGDLA